MSIRVLAAAAAIAFATVASGQTLQLVTDDEARQPDAPAKPASRAITRGPGVKLVSSDAVSGAFSFKVAFEPRGGSKVDPASVKIEYLKGGVVDLTERLKGAVTPEGIAVASASAPAGQHPIRVSVRDSEGRQGIAEFSLTVK